MTVLERMGEWIAADGSAAPPLSVREKLAVHLLDAMGAWIAGGATEEGQMLARLATSPGQPLAALGQEPLDRIALGVARARLTEIDDIHMPSCTTPGSVVVPTAFLIARHLPQSDARIFAQALWAGYEVMTRFGMAVAGPGLLQRGIWPTYLAAPVCAAAVTARLLGLTADGTADALAIALTMTSGAPGRPTGNTPRWLLLGMAARAGCTAALAASEGYGGDRTLLDDDWMLRTHGIACDARAFIAAVEGEGAVGSLSLKPYCAAKQTIAAIDALREVLDRGISRHDIVTVRVAVPPAHAGMIGHRNAAASRMARITSAAYQLALAACLPDELDNIARPNLAADPEIAAFMARVDVFADSTLEPMYPERWPAFVEVILKNGQRHAAIALDAKGDPGRRGDVDVRAKFHRLADPVIGKPAADPLLEACLTAPKQDDALATLCAQFNP